MGYCYSFQNNKLGADLITSREDNNVTEPVIEEERKEGQYVCGEPIRLFLTHEPINKGNVGTGNIKEINRTYHQTDKALNFQAVCLEKRRHFKRHSLNLSNSILALSTGKGKQEQLLQVHTEIDRKEMKHQLGHQKSIRAPLASTNSLSQLLSIHRAEIRSSLEDEYELLEGVGRGSYGLIRKVRHKFSGEIRALKIIQKSQCESLEKVSEEISILKRLDHPNVLRFFEFYQDVSSYYLITEFCLGGNLLEQLSKCRTFSENEAAMIMIQAFSAVKYCHTNNIIHRDLKPENLMFEKNDIHSTLKLIDYGRSKTIKMEQRLNEKAGSLYYAAPEVLQEKDYNEKCDMWSCGVILYLLLAGTPPFYGKEKSEVIEKIKQGKPQYREASWHSVSIECRSLLNSLLVYDPAKRISAKKALKHKFFAKAFSCIQAPSIDLGNTLDNLRSFYARLSFQKVVLTFVGSHYCSDQEESQARLLFDIFDSDKDGTISKEEFVEGFYKLYGDRVVARREATRIFENIDLNNNGQIEYHEFLIGSAELNQLLCEKKLKQAFDFYDKDKNGFITFEELHEIIGCCYDEKSLKELISEVDTNKDGQISFEEFRVMMETSKNLEYLKNKFQCISC